MKDQITMNHPPPVSGQRHRVNWWSTAGCLLGLWAAGPCWGAAFTSSADVNLTMVPYAGLSLTASVGTPTSLTLSHKYLNDLPFNFNAVQGGSPWVQLDLGAGNAQSIDSLRLRQYNGQQAGEYRIWVGNNPADFTNDSASQVKHVTGNSAYITTDTFTATSGRYLRLQLFGNAGFYGVRDLSVYSTDPKSIAKTTSDVFYQYPLSESKSGGATATVLTGTWDANGANLIQEHNRADYFGSEAGDDPRTFVNTQTLNGSMELTLAGPYNVDHAVFAYLPNASFGPGGVLIERSLNDVDWVTAYDETSAINYSTSPVQTYTFTNPGPAQYFRYTLKQRANNGTYLFQTDFFGVEIIPEPSTLFLFSIGALLVWRRVKQ